MAIKRVETTTVDTLERYVILRQRRRPGRDGSRSGWDVTVVDQTSRHTATGSGRTLEDAESRAWDRLESEG